ncbi:MAG TPA: 5-oxoprolinase subunit PxpA [Gemmatimonadaceae bacterium]|nr:5-oxoprolinase subunit PxpA [Gemmatimonadaceae bacterium]
MTRSIDLNADLGEHEGDGTSSDMRILDLVSSASIACGVHSGSAAVMEMTVQAAMERGVSIGAHPSYPDREGFGRRDIDMPVDQILESVRDQIISLEQTCATNGARLAYVKPHGALYNRAARDSDLARQLADLVASINPELVMLALSGSALESSSRDAGLQVACEAFIDRAYMSDGTLMPRDRSGAVIDDASIAGGRAVEMAKYGKVRSFDGKPVLVTADSLCVHGDSRNAIQILDKVRRRLTEVGFTIAPFAV